MTDPSPTTEASDLEGAPPAPRTLAYEVCFGIVTLIFVAGLVGLYRRPVLIDERTGVADEVLADPDPRIDPNTASWQDLAQLPGIGEVKAREIVRYREEARNDPQTAHLQPFGRPEDLDAVRGIGPKTVEKLRPHLRFLNHE